MATCNLGLPPRLSCLAPFGAFGSWPRAEPWVIELPQLEFPRKGIQRIRAKIPVSDLCMLVTPQLPESTGVYRGLPESTGVYRSLPGSNEV
jgi:hypothetical protein